RNTAATFDVFYWLQITNFDAFLFNPAPSGLDYNDVWPLCVHAQNASGLSPKRRRQKCGQRHMLSCSFLFSSSVAAFCLAQRFGSLKSPSRSCVSITLPSSSTSNH